MDKTNILKTFNDHFEEFMNDVLRVFPDDGELIACREALRQVRKVNPKLIIVVFKEDILGPYSEEIVDNNISFFINKNYQKDIRLSNSKKILDKIDKIRDSVRSMTDGDKEKVAKYLNNLLKLCNLYN